MPNPYLLAADNDPSLLPLLRENPSLAAAQDEHGYSLIHAAASYNHLDLLRSLVQEFNVPVDLRDEDGETALFVVESVAAARVLVEELHLDQTIQNDEGQIARDKIEAEGDWMAVVEYLRGPTGATVTVNGSSSAAGTNDTNTPVELPPVPEGLSVTVGTMSEDAGQEPDPEFRRLIEQLAAREDLQTPEGQAELQRLVEAAISEHGLGEGRNTRTRQS